MFFRYTRTCRRSKYIPEGTLVEAFWRLPGVRVVPMDKRHHVKYLLYVVLCAAGLGLVLGAAGLVLWALTASGALEYFLDWVGKIGFWGNLIMILLIIAMQFPFMVGYGSMMLTSGFLFGFWGGLATLIIGCQIGLLFVGGLSRFFFKEKSQKYINKNAYVKALVEELLDHKIKFSFLVRITPLPVGLQNVMMSINVPVWLYVVSSFFGMLIEQVPMVYIGTTAMELAEIFTGKGEMDPMQLVVIGITGAGILLVVAFLFYVSHKALKKVKQRQLEMETEIAEEGEEALDLEDEAYDAEDAEGVLELELDLDDWVDVGEGLEELESYAGTDINSAEHMQTVSSCERLCEMVPADDAPCMLEEYVVEDDGVRTNVDDEVEIVLEKDENQVDMNTSVEETIARLPPKSSLTRKTSLEVRSELMANEEEAVDDYGRSDSSQDIRLGLSGDRTKLERSFDGDDEDGSMLEELELFGDDEDTEEALDAMPARSKKSALGRLHDAITKPKKLKATDSKSSLVSSLPLTGDEDYV